MNVLGLIIGATSHHLSIIVRQCRQFTLLALIGFLCVAPFTQAQLSPPPSFDLSSNSSTGNTPQANPFTNSNQEFLPVDEAYQLSVSASEHGITAQWVIAGAYFLYGEQFAFSIDGKSLPVKRASGTIAYDQFFEKDVEKHYIYTESVIEKNTLNTATGESLQTPHTLSITYQGCADAGLCYPPETRLFTINGTQITASDTNVVGGNLQKSLATTESRSGIRITLLMLLLAICGGAILNLMPCVFPVLSIKALSLANHTETRSRIAHGWSYTAGCVLTFIVIAATLLAVRSAGQAVGWGFQLQSPAVITFLSLLFFMMGLTLMGHIQLNHRWMGAGQSLTQGSQHSHSFFTGALAAVVASPCTAPFMATALGYALTQPTSIALLIFAGLGFGMALPFLLLSHLPQLNRILPRPGQWMDTFKQAVAFPLYLTSLWLLWVLGQQVGINGVIATLFSGLLVIFCLWLRHIYRNQSHPLLANAVTVLCFFVLATVIWQNNHLSDDNPTIEDSKSLWQPYSPEKLAQLRENNATIFVNLTADWCITCKWNEKRVFTEKNLQAMTEKGVYLLEGDWTRYNKDITALLDEYGRGGVPLYLLFRGNSSTPATTLPQLLNPSEFEQMIQQL